jgi:hypothetical protein
VHQFLTIISLYIFILDYLASIRKTCRTSGGHVGVILGIRITPRKPPVALLSYQVSSKSFNYLDMPELAARLFGFLLCLISNPEDGSDAFF